VTQSIESMRLGVVGLGRMGRVHAQNLAYGVPGARLAGVVDSRPKVAAAVGRELGVPSRTALDDLLVDVGVDGVVIATPLVTHAALVEQVAAAGKHVLCEKPFAVDEPEALRAIEATERAGVKLQVGFHRRFDADFAEAARRVHAGETGRTYQYHASMRDMRLPPDEVLRAERVIVDAMCHEFDAARWIVGEIEELTTFGAGLSSSLLGELGEPDNTVVVARFANGALGVLENSRVAGYGFECRAEVMGSEATVRVAHHRRRQVAWLTPGQETVDHAADFLERFRSAYPLQLESFAAAIQADRPVCVDGWDGLAAVRLCTAAMRSLAEGRTIAIEPVSDLRP
jgi:myo-inositol 2-dehydrogenase/D-chiro-inositol 1-dehydrogenase